MADPLDEENLLKPSGRGIFYMDKFMDEIRYDFGPAGGTELTLRKSLESLSGSGTSGESEEALQ